MTASKATSRGAPAGNNSSTWNVLVTGAAGFIGYHVSAALAAARHTVVGVDNFNNYYDVRLKHVNQPTLAFSSLAYVFLLFTARCTSA